MALLAAPLAAQSLTVAVGDSARVTVASGARVAIPLRVALPPAGSALTLASLSGTLAWGAGRLTLDSIRGAPGTGFTQTANTGAAATGSAALSYFSGTRLMASGALATAWFTAGSPGGTRVQFTPTAAGSEGGASILGHLATRDLAVCVPRTGRWGDVTGDAVVTIVDAQQVARFAVGLAVTGPEQVTERGDVTADGRVDVLDAQQVARFSAGLSAASRINTALSASPEVAAVTLAPEPVPAMLAGRTVALAPRLWDAAGGERTGCAEVTYASSAPAVATVNAAGLVTGVAVGTAIITAAAGGRAATTPVTISRPFVLAENGVTVRCPLAAVGDSGVVNGVTYTRRSEAQLRALVAARQYAAVSTTCTTGITSLRQLFRGAATFNAPLATWDVSGVTDMAELFADAPLFNQPLAAWDVSRVANMGGMFARAAAFNQPIGNWDVGAVTHMSGMFDGASAFNRPLERWSVRAVRNMAGMFRNARAFNQPLEGWDVSGVIDMSVMFSGATAFNQPLAAWNVASVLDMSFMFWGTQAFNRPLAAWDVGQVRSMRAMFQNAAAFNQPIGGWNVGRVTDLGWMFARAAQFNQELGGWNVGSVETMERMFAGSPFNRDIGGWNVRTVADMTEMFAEATAFNQDLGRWCVTRIAAAPTGFDAGAPQWTRARPRWGTCPG
ncbi:MAG: BspA family leucine-rich repeat surface protein [Gemmatimonadetes bacterium]|nr:BspA family leucine-rich repeat surface protein [Gemmatimonadota bacterium]